MLPAPGKEFKAFATFDEREALSCPPTWQLRCSPLAGWWEVVITALSPSKARHSTPLLSKSTEVGPGLRQGSSSFVCTHHSKHRDLAYSLYAFWVPLAIRSV